MSGRGAKLAAPLATLALVMAFVITLWASGVLDRPPRERLPSESLGSAETVEVLLDRGAGSESERPQEGDRRGDRESTSASGPATASRSSSTTETGEQEPTTTAAAAKPTSNESQSTYRVKEGDTPNSIAEKLGVGVEELMSYNEIDDPTRLQVGQVLQIPPAE